MRPLGPRTTAGDPNLVPATGPHGGGQGRVVKHALHLTSDYAYGPIRRGMREPGHVAGRNLVIEWRSAENKSERPPP